MIEKIFCTIENFVSMHRDIIVQIIAMFVLIFIVIPVVCGVIVFHGSIYTIFTNEEWRNFLGSYMGGAVGGACALLVGYISISYNKKMQQDNQERDARNERKKFADSVAKDVDIYITQISKYFYTCRYTELLEDKKLSLKYKLNDIEGQLYIPERNDIESQSSDIKNFEELKREEDNLKNSIEEIDRELKGNQADRTVATERYYSLNYKLKNISIGREMLDQLYIIQRNSPMAAYLSNDFITKETKKLLDCMEQFIDKYIDNDGHKND